MGEITGSPDGRLFALSPLQPREGYFTQPNMIEWRCWDDLLPVRSSEVPNVGPEVESLASSPDGRWLVIGSGYDEQLFLLDWKTGEVISHHATDQYNISGLTFDPTSTFLAGLISGQGSGLLQIWRIDPAERFVPRPAVKRWPTYEPIQQDYVCGSMALTVIHGNLDAGPTFRSLRNVIFDYFERRLINPGFAEAHDTCCSCPSIAALLINCQGSSIWALSAATPLCSLSPELAWVLSASPGGPQNNHNLSKPKLRNVGRA
jgi:WD40 repeat protein